MIKVKEDINSSNHVSAEDHRLYDVTIIGGGAVGLFTAFYCGLRGLKTKLIEASEELGGKVTIGFPDKIVSDIGGIPEITGSDLIQQLIQQAKTFGPTILCGQQISDLEQLQDGRFRLTSKSGETHNTRSIILTVGNGIIQPLKLDVPHADKYENESLYYLVEDYTPYKGKHVLISGGGDSAVDWAIELSTIAKSVTVIHRRDEFRALEANIQSMKKRVNVLTPYRVQSVQGEGHQIKSVTIEHFETGNTRQLEIDTVLVNHGFSEKLGGINNWGISTKDGKMIVNDAMETNIPGIFAAGDIVTYPNKLNLFVAGFTEGPMAVNSASNFLNPKSEPMAMYSTHHEQLLAIKGQ